MNSMNVICCNRNYVFLYPSNHSLESSTSGEGVSSRSRPPFLGFPKNTAVVNLKPSDMLVLMKPL